MTPKIFNESWLEAYNGKPYIQYITHDDWTAREVEQETDE